MATLTQVGGQLYDQGNKSLGGLAAALVKATGVPALTARSAAAGVIAAKSKPGAATPTPVTPVSTPTPATAVVGFADAATATRNVLAWLSDQGTWVRIGYVVLGGALVLVGTKILVEGQVEGAAVKIVGGAVGQAVKGIKGKG